VCTVGQKKRRKVPIPLLTYFRGSTLCEETLKETDDIRPFYGLVEKVRHQRKEKGEGREKGKKRARRPVARVSCRRLSRARWETRGRGRGRRDRIRAGLSRKTDARHWKREGGGVRGGNGWRKLERPDRSGSRPKPKRADRRPGKLKREARRQPDRP